MNADQIVTELTNLGYEIESLKCGLVLRKPGGALFIRVKHQSKLEDTYTLLYTTFKAYPITGYDYTKDVDNPDALT